MTDAVKKILTVAVEIAIIAGAAFFAMKGLRSMKLPSLRRTEIRIDLTLENIRKMSELSAATYCSDMMVSKTKGELFPGAYRTGGLPSLTKNDIYEVIVKGRATAVIDLSRAEVSRDESGRYTLTLPKPEIRVASPNPSDCKPFRHTGSWNEDKDCDPERGRSVPQDGPGQRYRRKGGG